MKEEHQHAPSSAPESIFTETRRLTWTSELSDEELSDILATAQFVEFEPGEKVIEVDAETTHVYFIIRGSLDVKVHDTLGKQVLHTSAARGAVFGLFSIVLPEPSVMEARATERTAAIRLTRDQLLDLTSRHREFQLAILRLSANVAKRLVMVNRTHPQPAVVGVVHHTPASRPLTNMLVQRLAGLEERVCVAGDDERSRPESETPFRLLVEGGRLIPPDERMKILKQWASYGRLLIDVDARLEFEFLAKIMAFSDVVLWCVREEDAQQAAEMLRALEGQVPGWREKIRIVWILSGAEAVAPDEPELVRLAARDFKLTFDAPTSERGVLLGRGVERIVHHLRGIQIGLALGGGAARGMAHLGVLKALEDNGIYIDMLAGTSAGAMTGTIYAAGLNPDYATQCFKRDLLPNWFFRRLPAGGYFYLLYKYRLNRFEPMLRKYLGRAKMEQLIVPTATISVDLVEGRPLVRQTGDATVNILESINLPPLSLPRIDADQALVDGGLLNNVPANVLLSKGCNFVIASTVTAKIEKDFMGIRSGGRARRRLFATIQVVMRQNMIQSFNMNSVGIEPADFVIAPDVTMFDLSEFTRADEMSVVGETTTRQSIDQLRGMLAKLDGKLFSRPPST
ncbi:MAG: cyclic nucleotide-binding and patatin-like phospholipase domain-containing protein [Pirellulaceae bacterium]